VLEGILLPAMRTICKSYLATNQLENKMD